MCAFLFDHFKRKSRSTYAKTQKRKHAIECMYINTHHSIEESRSIPFNLDIFPDVVESIKITLASNHGRCRTAIAALGQIAKNMSVKFKDEIEKMLSKQIVKGMLLKESKSSDVNMPSGDEESWCDEESLPENTREKITAFKTMAKWLSGLKDGGLHAQKTFRLLSSFIKQKGDLLECGLSPAEMSWIRLSAGKAMLNICAQKGNDKKCSIEQFYMLSTLMIDPVEEVRALFVKKLVDRSPSLSADLEFMYVLSFIPTAFFIEFTNENWIL